MRIVGLVDSRTRDQFRQLSPPSDLAPYVEAILERRAGYAPANFEVFPGARAELLFHFADPFFASPANSNELTRLWPAAFLGPRTGRCGQRAGPAIDWLIVQLTPSGCRRFLGQPFGALIDYDAPLEDLMPGAHLLWEQLAAMVHFEDRATVVVAWLRQRFCRVEGDVDISRLIALTRARPISSAGALATLLGNSERRLRQRFAAEVGVAPKRWLKLMRANRYLWSLHADRLPSDFEFADESHAIREFKRFADMTPGEYRRLKARGDPLVNTGRNHPLTDTTTRPPQMV